LLNLDAGNQDLFQLWQHSCIVIIAAQNPLLHQTRKPFPMPTPKPHYQILLIEDNPGDVRFIQEYLAEIQTFTYQLIHAETLRRGMVILGQEKVDIVLLSLILPDSMGRNTLDTLLRYFPETNLIVVTGCENRETSCWAIERGAQDYLYKSSLESAALERAINHAMRRHKLVKDLFSLLEECVSELKQELPPRQEGPVPESG
jgi:DNA-binding NarL/FixJ family response regulator